MSDKASWQPAEAKEARESLPLEPTRKHGFVEILILNF
jgi:hypothetical protein